MTDEIHEECGVFGVMTPESCDVARLTYYGLHSLQHRGQESCGIVVDSVDGTWSHKGMGLIGEVFTREVLDLAPKGRISVGHVRYGTTGGSNIINCQPLEIRHERGNFSIVHNGNLTNTCGMRKSLEKTGSILHTTSDTEVIAYAIIREALTADSMEDAVSRAMESIKGAYSLLIMTEDRIICVRDPHGFRPLIYGKMSDGTVVVASESCALTTVGAEPVRDLDPGEILTIGPDGIVSRREHCGTRPRRSCVFEYIYFARTDSVIDGVSVHAARIRSGIELARSSPVEADVVIGVPDAGTDAALGYSRESGIPFGIGLLKSRYVGRTFISPGQDERVRGVWLKLSVIKETVSGKRVVLVDDSIVRGTTMRRIVKLLREAGAKEIHIRISAPPFTNPCYYGTDVGSRKGLIACDYSIPEITRILDADSIGYLPLEKLSTLVGCDEYCSACFDAEYPLPIDEDVSADVCSRHTGDDNAPDGRVVEPMINPD